MPIGLSVLAIIEFLDSRLHWSMTDKESATNDISNTRFDDDQQVEKELLEWHTHLTTANHHALEMTIPNQMMLDADAERLSAAMVLQTLRKSSVANIAPFIISLLHPLLTDRKRHSTSGSATF